MIRIRAGESWKLNPETLAALRALPPRAARRYTPGEILDHLGIEVDGVDISAGLGEADLFRTVRDLVRAAADLLAGKPKAQVELGEGVELILVPAGADLNLSVVSLGRPARVLVRDVTVDAARFAEETAACADTLVADLRRINAALGESPLARALATGAAKARARAGKTRDTKLISPTISNPANRARAWRNQHQVPGFSPACGFDLPDDEGLLHSYSGDGEPDLHSLLGRGHLVLRLADGREAASHHGPVYLALRDLAAEAARLVAAFEAGEREYVFEFGPGGDRVAIDIAHGRAGVEAARANLRSARRPAAETAFDARPLDLARALYEAALDFAAAVAAREPRQEHNPYVRDLARRAAEGLRYLRELAEGDLFAAEESPPGRERRRTRRRPEEPPLGPGQLRRVVYREAWRAPVGPVLPEGLFLGGRARPHCVVIAGPTGLHGLDAASGTERWSLLHASPLFVARPDGDAPASRVLAAEPDGAVVLLDAGTGEVRWRRRTRLADGGLIGRRLLELPGDALACVLDRRVVACLDAASGRFHWRFAPPEANRADLASGEGLVYVTADNGFLYALEAASGRPAFRLRTALRFLAAPAIAGEVLLVLGDGAAGAALSGLDPRTGRSRWSTALDLDAARAPLLWRGMAVVPGEAGGIAEVVAVSLRSGRVRFRTRLTGGAHGVPALAAQGATLVAVATNGAAASLDPKGGVVWSRRARSASHSAPPPTTPIVRRDLAVCPGDPTVVLRADTGSLLDALRTPAPAAAQICTDEELSLYLCDEEGPVACYRLATHLSLV